MRFEKAVYEEVVSLSAKKSEAIAGGQIDILNEIVRDEQTCLVKIHDLERRREAISGKFSELCGKPAKEITMRDIIEVAPESGRGALQALHAELSDVLSRQSELNDINRRLIESKLEYINFSLDVMTSNGNTGTYSQAGSESASRRQKVNIIDQKA